MRLGRLVLAVALLGGCSTYHDALERGQTAYEHNDHERALAIFRTLERDTGHFSPQERAEYFYLRGMTDFRIGYRADARHWLVLAKAEDDHVPGTLPGDWKSRMDAALAELNPIVYEHGPEALTNAPPTGR